MFMFVLSRSVGKERHLTLREAGQEAKELPLSKRPPRPIVMYEGMFLCVFIEDLMWGRLCAL